MRGAVAPDGVRRSVALLRAFRVEQADPAACYRTLSEDAVTQMSQYAPIAGARVLDVGGGPGYLADAVARAGGWCATVDASAVELRLHDRRAPVVAVSGGAALPYPDGAFDLTCSFNTLEHIADRLPVLGELIRVTRPRGTVFLSVTTWWSPWGGHETSPWHYLGAERAARRYERRYGHPPKNRYGSTLFKVEVRDLLRWATTDRRVELVEARPRYYPSWCRPIVRIPGIREVATWNLALVLRRR